MRTVIIAHTGKYFFGICLFCFITIPVWAQQTDTTQIAIPDTSLVAAPDTTAPPGLSQQRLPVQSENPVPEDAVEFESSDSLIIDFQAGKKAFLFGSAK